MSSALCVHKSKLTAAFTNFGNFNNNLHPNCKVSQDYLADYIDCLTCNIQTPTVGNRFKEGIIALAKVIYYFVQRPFAFLLLLPFNEDFDAIRHPLLAKCARTLCKPSIYQKIAQEEFLGYFLGGSNGKARVINAQYSKEIFKTIIEADHFKDINTILNCFHHPKGGPYSDDEMEKERIALLRDLNPLLFSPNRSSLFQEIDFQTLINQGYLKP